jgi:hypothetical protein
MGFSPWGNHARYNIALGSLNQARENGSAYAAWIFNMNRLPCGFDAG